MFAPPPSTFWQEAACSRALPSPGLRAKMQETKSVSAVADASIPAKASACCICPYHKNCFEGFACGPSIEARWGKKAVELKDRKEVWEMESFYIAQALVDYIMILSPRKIILGGGVMHQEQLFPLIREKVKEMIREGRYTIAQISDMMGYCSPTYLSTEFKREYDMSPKEYAKMIE